MVSMLQALEASGKNDGIALLRVLGNATHLRAGLTQWRWVAAGKILLCHAVKSGSGSGSLDGIWLKGLVGADFRVLWKVNSTPLILGPFDPLIRSGSRSGA